MGFEDGRVFFGAYEICFCRVWVFEKNHHQPFFFSKALLSTEFSELTTQLFLFLKSYTEMREGVGCTPPQIPDNL